MTFDDHEIWNRPVPDSLDEAVPAPTAPAPNTGRLYASAGAPAHPDAIVALPQHTRSFVSVAELPESVPASAEPVVEVAAEPVAAPPTPPAPIINDPAIAEVLATPAPAAADIEEQPSFEWAENIEVKAEPLDQFKDWFADPVETPAPAPVKTGLAAQHLTDAATRARTQLSDIGDRVTAERVDIRRYTLIAVVATAVVGVADAFLGGTIGWMFGIALVASTTFGAFNLRSEDAWIGWVMPAYVAIAAILVAGQFGSARPGFDIVGQILLVGTTLISVAPWLAAATVLGLVIPRVRKR